MKQFCSNSSYDTQCDASHRFSALCIEGSVEAKRNHFCCIESEGKVKALIQLVGCCASERKVGSWLVLRTPKK